MGYRTVVMDIDQPHLKRAGEKNILEGVEDRIHPVLVDATGELPIRDGSLDAVLNAGFGYLIPPEELDSLFGKMTKILRPGGLLVFEFATNRDRRASVDSKESLIGANEYNYRHDEGLSVLQALSDKHG